MTIETRTAPVTLELREDGRTLAGLAVPYNVEARIGGRFVEVFRAGAFSDNDPAEVPLLATHDREQLPIGRALTLTETPDGLEAELRVSETRQGDEVLTLIRDGAATGLSVGFTPIEDRWSPDRRRVERLRARLIEISITAFPAYESARIAQVRHQDAERPRLLVARLRQ